MAPSPSSSLEWLINESSNNDSEPELQDLEVQLKIDYAKKVFSAFVGSRESMDVPLLRDTEPRTSHTEPNVSRESPKMDRPSLTLTNHFDLDLDNPYRKQAKNIISICQTFVYTQEQTVHSYDELRSICQVVDDTLISANEAQMKTSKFVGKKFKKAIDVLSDYESKRYSKKTVAKRADAGSKYQNRGSPITVDFLIHRSPFDDSPTTVKVILDKNSELSEVLWMFGRFKDKEGRLSLKQNPHFYRLPSFPRKYGGEFRMNPIQTFRYEEVSVLIDSPDHAGRVFLETKRVVRAFGNAWEANDTIIFKDVCGRLEGESIVGASIEGIPNLWCIEERPLPLSSHPPLSPIWSRPSESNTMTATQITSAEGILIWDWRIPIRRMLQSRDVNIRITDKRMDKPSPKRDWRQPIRRMLQF